MATEDGCCACRRSSKLEFFTTFFAGCLVMMTLGTNYCIGNVAPYIISYLHFHVGQTSSYVNTGSVVWIFAVAACFQGIGMLTSGFLVQNTRIGKRLGILIGCVLSSFGLFLTTFSVNHSFELIIFTSGCLFGLGQGLAYALVIDSITSWTTDKKGLFTGILVCAFAFGSIIFSPLQTHLINPHNLSTDKVVGHDKLFSQVSLLARVPRSYVYLSMVVLGIQLIVTFLIRPFPVDGDESEQTMLMSDVHRSAASGGDGQRIGSISTISDTDLDREKVTSEDPTEDHSDPDLLPDSSLSLRESVNTLPFIILTLSMMFLGPCTIVLPSLEKSFGETFIKDDMFLSVMIGVSAGCNACGRLVAGICSDRLPMRACLFVLAVLLAAFYGMVPLSKSVSSPVFLFCLVALTHFTFSGMFVYYPYAVDKLYGSVNFPQIYGLVFMAKAVSGLIMAALCTVALPSLGWVALFAIPSLLAAFGAFTVLFLNNKKWSCSLDFKNRF